MEQLTDESTKSIRFDVGDLIIVDGLIPSYANICLCFKEITCISCMRNRPIMYLGQSKDIIHGFRLHVLHDPRGMYLFMTSLICFRILARISDCIELT